MKKLFTLWLALLFGLAANAQTKFVKSVPTLTELRALNVADIHTNVLVNSYWTSNTNSVGALFQWVPGATDATNTTSVFAPASGTGRWIRVELPANPGSATQPGFRFLGDDNTGIYNSGADAIDFSTGGSRRWGITSAGILQSQGAQTISSSSSTLTLQPVGSLIVSPNSSEAVRVLTTGAVGIGTTGPDRKLDILDASNPQIRLTQTDGTVYSEAQTLSTGHLVVTTSGGNRITSTTVNDTSVLARQVQGGLAFDGVTASTRVTHTLGSGIGTGDFSVRVSFVCPTSTSTVYGIISINSSNSDSNAVGSFQLYFNGDGTLKVRIFGPGATADSVTAYVSGFVTAFSGKLVDVVFTRSGTTDLFYANGVAQTLVEGSTGTNPTWAASIPGTYVLVGSLNGNLFNSTIFSATLFNRALSASEVITLANQGVQEADKWGLLTGQTSGTLTRGKRYRITTFVAGDSFTNVGAGSNATGVEFVATGTTPTTWTNASTLNQIGSILDADLSAGVGYQVPDRSSNKYHGVVSASGTSWTQANRRGQIRYTTTGATTGAFQLLSSTAIPANALIQSIVAWSAGTPLIYVGTATGTSNIVGHTTLVGSTYTPLTLSSQFSTTGNLWLNKSATNEVNLTVNYMIADP